jgi:hypothetical protein
MIKLLWNTHKQITNQTNTKNNQDATNHKWGIYHKKSSDKWIFEILENIKYQVIEDEQQIESTDILIIVDSSVDKKKSFYEKLNLICSQIFLIHLGDESGIHDLSNVYDNCIHVWRTFCLNKYFTNSRVSCLPIGYKSGTILNNKEKNRKFKWAFLGTQHKSSRQDLLFQLSDIKPFYSYKTPKFDQKIIDVNEMSKILSSSTFIPCPNGFVHPETYRLYEALECGCIPIVENTYQYYERLFPSNPFLKVDKWSEAKSIIRKWDNDKIEKKQKECHQWWQNYKEKLKKILSIKITNE